jgi:hypothetical protein
MPTGISLRTLPRHHSSDAGSANPGRRTPVRRRSIRPQQFRRKRWSEFDGFGWIEKLPHCCFFNPSSWVSHEFADASIENEFLYGALHKIQLEDKWDLVSWEEQGVPKTSRFMRRCLWTWAFLAVANGLSLVFFMNMDHRSGVDLRRWNVCIRDFKSSGVLEVIQWAHCVTLVLNVIPLLLFGCRWVHLIVLGNPKHGCSAQMWKLLPFMLPDTGLTIKERRAPSLSGLKNFLGSKRNLNTSISEASILSMDILRAQAKSFRAYMLQKYQWLQLYMNTLCVLMYLVHTPWECAHPQTAYLCEAPDVIIHNLFSLFIIPTFIVPCLRFSHFTYFITGYILTSSGVYIPAITELETTGSFLLSRWTLMHLMILAYFLISKYLEEQHARYHLELMQSAGVNQALLSSHTHHVGTGDILMAKKEDMLIVASCPEQDLDGNQVMVPLIELAAKHNRLSIGFDWAGGMVSSFNDLHSRCSNALPHVSYLKASFGSDKEIFDGEEMQQLKTQLIQTF